MTKLRAVNALASTPTVYLDGCIASPAYAGPGDITAPLFREQLLALKGAPLIHVEINSDGGEITEGQAMYAALRQFPGRKIGIVTGIAASMASVILQACDERRVAKGAFVMIHLAQGGARGTAQEMRDAADTVDKMQRELLDVYMARTGLPAERITALLERDTYLTAEEAVQLGFADSIETFEARVTYPAAARLQRDPSATAKKVFEAIASRDMLPLQGDAKARAALYLERAKKGSVR